MNDRKYEVDVTVTSSSSGGVFKGPLISLLTAVPDKVSREIAPITDRSQAYYWTRAWQEGELETLASLKAGEGITFETPEEARRWLLSPDE